MKNIIPIINGACLILFILISIAFTTQTGRSIVLNEPITPKSTVILRETCFLNTALNEQAKPYLKQGYIVKCVSVSYGDCIIGCMVLEKY